MNTRPEKPVHSLAFSALGDLGSRVLLLVGYLVLARFLTPAQFGLITIVAVLIAVLRVVVDLGFGAAIIQGPDETEARAQTAFWTNTLLGTALSLLMFASAEPIAGFFDAPELTFVVEATAVVLVLHAMTIVPFSLLMKRREFRKVAVVELGAGATSVGLGIVFAIGGFGVGALVAMVVTSSLFKFLLSYTCCHWRVRWAYSWRDLVELAAFGLPLGATRLYGQIAVNIDKFLIGKTLSASLLGAYRLAFQIVEIPSQVVAGVFHRVFFSVYVEHGDDIDRIRRTHMLAMRSVAFFTFPALLGIGVLSERFVLVFLGEGWIEMVPILFFLALISLTRSVGVLNDVLYLSQGATGLQLKVVLVLRSVVILGIVIGIQFGILGLLCGLLAARLLNFYATFHFSGKLVGITVGDALRNLRTIGWMSLLMFGLLYWADSALSAAPNSASAFLLLVLFGAGVYLACSSLFMRRQLKEIFGSLAPLLRRGASVEG